MLSKEDEATDDFVLKTHLSKAQLVGMNPDSPRVRGKKFVMGNHRVALDATYENV